MDKTFVQSYGLPIAIVLIVVVAILSKFLIDRHEGAFEGNDLMQRYVHRCENWAGLPDQCPELARAAHERCFLEDVTVWEDYEICMDRSVRNQMDHLEEAHEEKIKRGEIEPHRLY